MIECKICSHIFLYKKPVSQPKVFYIRLTSLTDFWTLNPSFEYSMYDSKLKIFSYHIRTFITHVVSQPKIWHCVRPFPILYWLTFLRFSNSVSWFVFHITYIPNRTIVNTKLEKRTKNWILNKHTFSFTAHININKLEYVLRPSNIKYIFH